MTMGERMVTTMRRSTIEQKEFYLRYLEEAVEGKETKRDEEGEERVGGIKPVATVNSYKISSNFKMVGGNAPWHVLELLHGSDPTEHAKGMVGQILKGFTAQRNGSSKDLSHDEFVSACESMELDVEGNTLPERYGLESFKVFLCEDEAKDILSQQNLSDLIPAFLPWQGIGERDQNGLAYATSWAERKETAQQARDEARDLSIMRLIHNRDDVSVTVRRAVMTLDLLHDFGGETRATASSKRCAKLFTGIGLGATKRQQPCWSSSGAS
jgi:hypothetical protein